jgi:hypothetical protein
MILERKTSWMYSNISETEYVQKPWKLISSVASKKKKDAHSGHF